MYSLGAASKAKLVGVHPDLVRVVNRAIATTSQDFLVNEGVRTLARQRELYAKGRTTPGPVVTATMNSRHLSGHAIDLVPYPIDWNDQKKFYKIGRAMLGAAIELGIKIRWGYDWDGDGVLQERGEYDGPHFELSAKDYK